MSGLADKVAVVTGGSRGVGRAIVRRLAAEGCKVVSVSRHAPNHGEDDGVLELAADVSTLEGASRACETALGLGGLDVLVNNAAVIRAGNVEETDVATWDEVMAINVRGPYLCAKCAIPLMRRAGGGAIINIASINGVWAQPDLAAYCASKGAVIALTRSLALDYGRAGIRANCICPSYIRTDMLEQWYDDQDDPSAARHAAAAMHPAGRVAEPEEIAGLVAWLASDEALYMSGHPILIDGGLLAGQPPLGGLRA